MSTHLKSRLFKKIQILLHFQEYTYLLLGLGLCVYLCKIKKLPTKSSTRSELPSCLYVLCLLRTALVCAKHINLIRVSIVNARTVALQPIYGKISQHYSRYCAVEFGYMHNCELSYIYPGHNVKQHLHRVIYRIGCVGSGLILVKA